METLQLYANPYAYNARGFYFKTPEEYSAKYSAEYKRALTEEYSFEFIDGAGDQCEFAKLVELYQSNIPEWFEQLEQFEALEECEQLAVKFLIECNGLNFIDAIDQFENVSVYHGTINDYAFDYVNDNYDLEQTMGNLSNYFDYDSFARDLLASGDCTEYGEYIISE